MRSWTDMSGGLKAAIIASAILALAIVGVLVDEQFGADNDGAVQVRETVTADPEDIKPTGQPLDLGVEAKISSNYRVTITEVTRYEVPGGQLMAPTVKATYIGKDDGEPWSDLSLEFSTPGSEEFGELECPAGVAENPEDRATLKKGDEATYVVCLNVLDKDTKGGRITVQEAFTNDKGAWWSTEEAVTEALPSVASQPPAARAPAAAPQRPRQADNDDETTTCEDWDDEEYEEYKEFGDQRKEQFEEYKDAGGNNEELIDDFEDWEEAYDEQMELLRKYHDAC